MVMNAENDAVSFILPTCTAGEGWTLVVDTNTPKLMDKTEFRIGETYIAASRSLFLFQIRPSNPT